MKQRQIYMKINFICKGKYELLRKALRIVLQANILTAFVADLAANLAYFYGRDRACLFMNILT